MSTDVQARRMHEYHEGCTLVQVQKKKHRYNLSKVTTKSRELYLFHVVDHLQKSNINAHTELVDTIADSAHTP